MIEVIREDQLEEFFSVLSFYVVLEVADILLLLREHLRPSVFHQD